MIELNFAFLMCFTKKKKKIGSSGISQMTNIMDECHDMHGQAIEPGRHYVPGPDICRYEIT